MRTRALCLALAFIFAGCASASRPVLRTVRFDPPSQYHAWWGEMEECADTDGPYWSIRWYLVPGEYVEPPDVVGMMDPVTMSVYLPSRSIWAKGIVQHEMLHALLETPTHPVPPFGVCAPLVAVMP